ncbi:MAG: hypothetical protein WHX60_12100 [Armatimonadota bacterium]
MKSVSLFLVVLTASVFAQDTRPPLSALQRVVHRDYVSLETRVGNGGYQGISWWECTEPPNPDVDGETLLSLLYRANEMPGYALIPNDFNGIHTGVRVYPPGKSCEAGRTFSSLSNGTFEEGREAPVGTVMVQVEIMPSVQEAQKRLEEYRLRMHHALVVGKDNQVVAQLPSGRSFGLPMYLDRRWDYSRALVVQAGRTVIRADVFHIPSVDEDFWEAVVWGLLYRLQRFPRFFTDGAGGSAPSDPDALNGVRMAPLSALRAASCTLEEDRPEVSWTKYLPAPVNQQFSGVVYARWKSRVQWGQRWVDLEAFSWQMKTWDGRQVKLSRPVFPYRGELIAPLQEVKQALGMQ